MYDANRIVKVANSFFEAGHTPENVAEALSVSVSTVYTAIRRANLRLIKQYRIVSMDWQPEELPQITRKKPGRKSKIVKKIC